MKYVIGRPINGISLNGLEYLIYPQSKERMIFESEEDAIIFLKAHGYTDESIEAEGIVIKEQEVSE